MTTATKITLSRFALIPLIIFFYLSGTLVMNAFFIQYGKLIAMILFIIAAATDWVDGYIARKYNQISDMGKLLDPIADKMLVYTGFILVATDAFIIHGLNNLLPVWLIVIAFVATLGRDLIVNALRMVASEKKIVIAADNLGKLKSVLQFAAISLLMFWSFDYMMRVFEYGLLLEIFEYLCIFVLSAATIVCVYSGVNYMVQYKDVFQTSEKEKKSWEEKMEENNEE